MLKSFFLCSDAESLQNKKKREVLTSAGVYLCPAHVSNSAVLHVTRRREESDNTTVSKMMPKAAAVAWTRNAV